MRYGMCIHNYMFPLICLGVKILKTIVVEQDGAEPTDTFQRALLHCEEANVGGQDGGGRM
jgi:hypothetical protein